MPTIKQLPAATSVSATDVLPISQGGTTKGLAVSQLLSSTQAALSLASGKLLGRVSTTAGGPEPVGIGAGLLVDSGVLSATASDHTTLPVSTVLAAGDEVVVNSAGAARRLPATALRSLFSAGPGLAITDGTISSTATGYSLPAATTTTLGGVRADGRSVLVDGNGVLSAVASPIAVPVVLGAGSAAPSPITAAGASLAMQNGNISAADVPGAPDAYDGVRSVLVLQPGSSVMQASAVGGYVLNRSVYVSGTGKNAGMALWGESVADVDGAQSWGLAVSVHDGRSGGGSGAGRVLTNQIDVGINHVQTAAVGLKLSAAFGVQPANADGYVVATAGSAADSGAARWVNGLYVRPGSAVTAVRLGSVAGTAALGSMPLVFEAVDAGGVARTARIEADPNAAVLVTGAALTLQTAASQTFASFSATGGLLLPPVMAAGVSGSQSLVLTGRDAANASNSLRMTVDGSGNAQVKASSHAWQTAGGAELMTVGPTGVRVSPSSSANGVDSLLLMLAGRGGAGALVSVTVKADAAGNAVVTGADILFQISGAVRVNGSALLNTGALPATGGLLATSGVAGAAQAASTAQFEAMMTAWLQSKPTAPAATPGWWNNSGNPTYS